MHNLSFPGYSLENTWSLKERPRSNLTATSFLLCCSFPHHHFLEQGGKNVPGHGSNSIILWLFGSPAKLPGVVHVGACFNIAFFWIVDGGCSCVSSSKDKDETIESDCRSVFVICRWKKKKSNIEIGYQGWY